MFKNIKAVAMDVDGVLTDGGFWFGTSGEELKRFCFADVTGINKARHEGIILALISGESSQAGMTLAQRFADKVKIANVFKGCQNKELAIREFASSNNLSMNEICFIGDDVADLGALKVAGVSVAPADAHPTVISQVRFIAKCKGGHGVVREVLDLILEKKENG